MIIVGDNLRGLIEQHNICNEQSFDEFSITLTLGNNVFRATSGDTSSVTYDQQDVAMHFQEDSVAPSGLMLAPRDAVLACSAEKITMPLGYMGLVQTKGTLARLFTTAFAADSQVEPGYSGRITLELVNHAPFTVILPPGSSVAQLFILRCSTSSTKRYAGRYQNAEGPTLSRPRAR